MTPPALTSSRTPVVLAAMAGLWLCWGSSLPAMRVMVATLPPLLASGTVFVVAGAVLAAARLGELRRCGRRQLMTSAGIGACLLGAQGLVAVAEQHVYASTAALLVAVVPLWVVLLRAPLGDRPPAASVLRLVLGFGGVSVVLIAGAGGPAFSPWVLVVIAAAAAWACGTLWASRSASLPTTGAATVIQLLAGGLVLLAAGAARGEPAVLTPDAVGTGSWLAFAYLVLIDSLAGFALYNWLLRTAPIGLVSTYAYAVPVVACVIGVLVLGEPLRPLAVLGAVMIVLAVAGEVAASRTAR